MMRIGYCLALCLTMYGAAAGQAVTAIATQTVKDIPSASARSSRITIAFDKTPLDVAIRAIAERSRTTITFVPNLLPPRRVTYRGEAVTPAAALVAILRGTDLQVEQARDGSLELVRVPARGRVAQGTVAGKVMDGTTKRPVVGASVYLEGVGRGTQTGEDGSFRLTDVAAGSHTLVIRRLGYEKATQVITMSDNGMVTIDVSLQTSANTLDQVVVTGTVVQTELKAVPNAMTIVTGKQLEERGITRLNQLFRGDIPGLYAQNLNSSNMLDEVTMFSRGAVKLDIGVGVRSNPIKTYVDGVELADSKYLSQIDPKSIVSESCGRDEEPAPRLVKICITPLMAFDP